MQEHRGAWWAFWLGWVGTLGPVIFWRAIDSYKGPAEALFVLWVGTMVGPVVVTALGSVTMLNNEPVPKPGIYFAVSAMQVAICALTALTAFAGKPMEVQPWTLGGAFFIFLVWLSATVVVLMNGGAALRNVPNVPSAPAAPTEHGNDSPSHGHDAPAHGHGAH